MRENTLSIIMPALNEEDNLLPSYETVKEAVKGRFDDYEVIIFNDGSTDNTGKVAEKIAGNDPRVRVIHHQQPMNIGFIYKKGIKMAEMEYVILVGGDNDVSAENLSRMFDARGKADMVMPYHLNGNIRPFLRYFISRGFVFFMNMLFGHNLKYYNGMVLHKRTLINSIDIKTDSFTYQAEALVKLLKRGHSFIEVGIYLSDRKRGSSKAFRLVNIFGVLKSIYILKKEIRRGNI